MKLPRRLGYALFSLLFVLFFSMSSAFATGENQPQDALRNAMSDAKLAAVRGPASVPLLDQATLDLPAGYAYIPVKEGTEIMEAMGNSVSSSFCGLVVPTDGATWLISIDFIKSGYIQDTEAKNWKADELLTQTKEGTNEENKQRKEKGVPTLDVVGWIAPPSYDATTHKLLWGIEAKDSDANELVNYNTIALGREGYFSFTLVTDKSSVSSDKEDANKILAAANYNASKRYEDYVAGKDRLAEYGLAALVTGLVAKKLGLLAMIGVFFVKIWKGLIILVLLFWKKIKKLLGLQK